MGDTVPNILLVFSNPKDDLDALADEVKDVKNLLRYEKNIKRSLDYDIYDDELFMDVILNTSGIPGYTASIFHFSGHAGQKAILLPDGKKSVSAVCNMLKKTGTKIVFLNGCSTKEFLEDLLDPKQTDVIAVIATYTKVRDTLAAKLSAMFYKLFIKQGNTLKDTFENMRNSFEDYILKSNGCDMTMRDVLEYSNSFPNEEKDTFQWGLFYKDISYGTITINSLLEVANTELDVLDKKIRDKKTELGKGQAKLAAFQGNIPEALKEVYDGLADGAKKLNDELNGLTEYREKIYRNIQKKEAEEKRQTLCNHFSNSIKRINYHEQREIYRMGAESLFGCYAAMGDPDCLIDLLLIKFSEDYELKGNHFFPLTICYTSNIGKKFWPELAIQLQLDENAEEQVIVRKMIEDIYFGSQLDIARSSHQHIFIKILIHGVPGEQVGTMVKSFWLAIQKFMTQYAFLGDKQIAVRHRIIMLLLDDSAGPERIDEIEKITVSINNEIETKLKIMPWIKPLNLEQIENWIVGNDLDRVGIEKKMAQDIFTESESGKIKKVLLSVKKRTDIKDLDLFQQLNL